MTASPEAGRNSRDPRAERRKRVAIHEAGHAVAIIALGGAFDSVSIGADGLALGRVRGPVFSPQGAPGRGWSDDDCYVVALYAARYAEVMLTGSFARRAASNDARLAIDHLRGRNQLDPTRVAALRRAARALIEEHRAECLSVARQLHEAGVLSGDQVRQLVASGAPPITVSPNTASEG